MVEVINSEDLNTYNHVATELKLAQIKVLTPMSLLLFIGSAMLAASPLVSPTLAEISDQYLTILTPVGGLIAGYWGVLILLNIGQCLLLTLTSKQETKETLVYGVGKSLGLINIAMTFWVFFWTAKYFLLAEVALFIAGLLGLGMLINLNKQSPPTYSKPLEFIFMHAPATMLFVIVLTCDIWQNGLMALGWYRYVGPLIDIPHGHWEKDHILHTWIATIIVLVVSLINSYIVFTTTDFVWALSAIYLGVALAFKSEYKPPQVFIPLIVGAALVFVAFMASVGFKTFHTNNERVRQAREEAEAERRALLD